jgi:hypothetical protein
MKMVHNGIEYGLLQAYGRGSNCWRHEEFSLDLGQVAELWRHPRWRVRWSSFFPMGHGVLAIERRFGSPVSPRPVVAR